MPVPSPAQTREIKETLKVVNVSVGMLLARALSGGGHGPYDALDSEGVADVAIDACAKLTRLIAVHRPWHDGRSGGVPAAGAPIPAPAPSESERAE